MYVVPAEGFEPPLPEGKRILSPCGQISASFHGGKIVGIFSLLGGYSEFSHRPVLPERSAMVCARFHRNYTRADTLDTGFSFTHDPGRQNAKRYGVAFVALSRKKGPAAERSDNRTQAVARPGYC